MNKFLSYKKKKEKQKQKNKNKNGKIEDTKWMDCVKKND